MIAGLLALVEVVLFVLVAQWIGVGWTVLAALATSALGAALLARQGIRALRDLRDRVRTRQSPRRALGDAGVVAAGGMLMLLPGFLGDLVGLLCLQPATRGVGRMLLRRVLFPGLPSWPGASVQVRSTRSGEVRHGGGGATASRLVPPGRVIEGQVAGRSVVQDQGSGAEAGDGQNIDARNIDAQIVEGQLIRGEAIRGEAISGQVIRGDVIDGEVVEGEVVDGELAAGPDRRGAESS